MREILSDLVAEQQSLDQSLQRISGRDWKLQTPARGWTIQDTISHLADSEELTAQALRGDADWDHLRSISDFDAYRQRAVEKGRKMRYQDVIEWWRGGRAQVVEPLSRMRASERIEWLEGTLSARTVATTRLMETWAHGLDIYSALDFEVEDTPRIRHICWLGWRSLPYAFKHAGEAFTPVRVEVIGPGYAKWVYGPEDTDQLIKGSASDFARLAVRRLSPGDTRLKVTGEVATKALEVVRAYL